MLLLSTVFIVGLTDSHASSPQAAENLEGHSGQLHNTQKYNDSNLQRLERITGYQFNNPEYFNKVFSHPGVCPENKIHFGRLENLGDKKLNSIVHEYLYRHNTDKDEQWLTEELKKYISNKNNAAIAQQLDLLSFCTFNSDNQIKKKGLKKIKADTCEALIGAICEDNNFKLEPVEKFIKKYWIEKDFPILNKISTKNKSQKMPTINYTVEILLNGKSLTGTHYAATKKQARILAAGEALENLKGYADLKKRTLNNCQLLNLLRENYGLPGKLHYEFYNKGSIHQVQLLVDGKPYTELYPANTKKKAKQLAAGEALEKTKLEGVEIKLINDCQKLDRYRQDYKLSLSYNKL